MKNPGSYLSTAATRQKKLAQLKRRLRAAQARYKGLNKRDTIIDERRMESRARADMIANILLGSEGQTLTPKRKASLNARFIRANKEWQRLEKLQKKIFEEQSDLEEKIGTLKENLRRVKAGKTLGDELENPKVMAARKTKKRPAKRSKKANRTVIKAKRVTVLNGSTKKRRNSITGDLKTAAKKTLSAGTKTLKKAAGVVGKAATKFAKNPKRSKKPSKKPRRNLPLPVAGARGVITTVARALTPNPRYLVTAEETIKKARDLGILEDRSAKSALNRAKKLYGGQGLKKFEAKKRNPRRRNKAPHISEADIAKLSPAAQAQLRAQLGRVEAQEAKASTPAQKKAAAKSRRSFLSRLGTRLRVIGQTKKYKVSARDLSKCKRKTIKVRGRHETDALAKAQSQLGSRFDQLRVGNRTKKRNACGSKKRNVTARSPRKSGGSRPRRRNSAAEDARREFAGQVTGYKQLYFPPGAPRELSTLGPLVLLRTESGDIAPVHGAAYLCQEPNGKLWIASSKPNTVLIDGPAQSFGHLRRVEYRCRKPHLGYPDTVTWFHDFEDPLPTLRSDGAGGLRIAGGGYTVKREGITG